jgi:hypothetical protein
MMAIASDPMAMGMKLVSAVTKLQLRTIPARIIGRLLLTDFGGLPGDSIKLEIL